MKKTFFQINLRDRNSFHVDQQAAQLIEFDSAEDLQTIFQAGEPPLWMVLSGGNNILFTRDYEGLLLTPVACGIEILEQNEERVHIRVEAGLEWDDLVAWSVHKGLWGLENLSLIPGKVGAAPVQNIGAYGAEAKDCLVAVEYFSVEERASRRILKQECRFGYRESLFKQELKGRAIITAVEFSLSCNPQPNIGYGDVQREVEARGGVSLHNIREAICAIRRSKLPDTALLGNAGSFFKNPVVDRSVAEQLKATHPDMPLYPSAEGPERMKLAAGWLIDRAGLKGYREGRVGVHEKQALVLVNYGGASGGEVLALARKVQQRVRERFGIEIDTEVNIW